MSYSITTTTTDTFTLTNARYLASKVITDLQLCSYRYGNPYESSLNDYQEELTELLRGRYLKTYEFGYKKNGMRVVSWFYTVNPSGIISSNDRPGGIFRKADILGATYFNFITYSEKWKSLKYEDQQRIKDNLPIQRTNGESPQDGAGYWIEDKNYHSGGCSVGRKTFVPN